MDALLLNILPLSYPSNKGDKNVVTFASETKTIGMASSKKQREFCMLPG